jgi:stearoyl-CoA desaturase (delta-9 desaturase)
MFAHDYRNGVRWWQYDPSKWFIRAMAWLGLAYNLKTVPWFKIQRALLDTQFVRAQKKLALFPRRAQLEQVRTRVAEEYEAFLAAVAEWTHVREQWLEQTKRAMVERWEKSKFQSQIRELEGRLRLQYRRMRLLQAEIG